MDAIKQLYHGFFFKKHVPKIYFLHTIQNREKINIKYIITEYTLKKKTQFTTSLISKATYNSCWASDLNIGYFDWCTCQ